MTKKFKYDIVGIGVKEGRIYADKQAQDDAGFWSLDSGKQFQKRAEEMTGSEYSRLPTDTRNLLKMKFGKDLYKMLGLKSQEELENVEKAVTSQENNESDDSEQKLRETLKSQGFSDEEIEGIISDK